MLADEFCTAIVGASVSNIRRLDHTWFFSFNCGWTVASESWWRVLTRDGIATSCEDDRQWFGRSKPFDAARVARRALPTNATRCWIDPISGDLDISFENGAFLQIFNSSAGYEGWQASNGPERSLIAIGGGKVVAI